MKNRFAVAALAALLGGAVATPVAFAGSAGFDRDITRDEVATFDAYLDQHPVLARQLQSDPALVNDGEFVEHHREFAEFMRNHPRVREELREHPGQFVYLRDHYEWTERADQIPTGEVSAFDGFLDNHREIAEQLSANPGLVSNEEFMEHHPGMAQFLENHPDLRARLERRPGMFMWREGHYEWAEEHAPRPDRGWQRRAER